MDECLLCNTDFIVQPRSFEDTRHFILPGRPIKRRTIFCILPRIVGRSESTKPFDSEDKTFALNVGKSLRTSFLLLNV
jgi:hypothetical protein